MTRHLTIAETLAELRYPAQFHSFDETRRMHVADMTVVPFMMPPTVLRVELTNEEMMQDETPSPRQMLDQAYARMLQVDELLRTRDPRGLGEIPEVVR